VRDALNVIGIMCVIGAVIVLVLWAGSACCADAQSVYVVTKYEGKLLELERAAIDDAFRQKITSLWTVWMSDEKGQPARAVAGATQARKAYVASMQEIERREQENNKR
jgi:hypothetical protein